MVEGGGLENRFPVSRNGGSNPSPSAINFPDFIQARFTQAVLLSFGFSHSLIKLPDCFLGELDNNRLGVGEKARAAGSLF